LAAARRLEAAGGQREAFCVLLMTASLPMNPLPLPYLQGYPPELLAQVQRLVADGRLAETVAARHPEPHAVRSERALVEYVQQLKARHLKSAPPLAKVAWDAKLQLMKHVLGTHTSVSRVQGRQLKAKREIRIATLFKEAPADFLHMIVVHELAHLKEPEHDRAFYALCRHMAPDYLALELDLRLWLTARALAAAVPGGTQAAEGGPGPQSPQPPGAQACHTP
jgi:UTP pyrophosphatase